MVTAVCNVYLGSPEKLAFFQQTFPRVYELSDNWLVFIRGQYKQQALDFIRTQYPTHTERCEFFADLPDQDWARSTRAMLAKARYDMIYVYLEDHFLMRSVEDVRRVVQEMKDHGIEYLGYSFFDVGLNSRSAEAFYPTQLSQSYSFDVTAQQLPRLRNITPHFYPFSLASISSRRYFERLLRIEQAHLIYVPRLLQAAMENVVLLYPRNRAFWFAVNRLVRPLGLRFVIYPPATPFNLEKSLYDCDEHLLPLRVAGLRKELFANWDDDNRRHNSSLIKRGLYPLQLRPANPPTTEPTGGQNYALRAGDTSRHQYYPEVPRVLRLPLKGIRLRRGSMTITSNQGESIQVRDGESVWLHANIPHTLTASEDCEYHAVIQP